MMKQVSIVFSLLLFVSQINLAIAQEDSKLSKYLPNYSTDDPSALYNGIPNISIPLYTLKGKGVSVPVSISYDASGITVAQEATSVGLGWVLNAGGHIIQEVRDWDDCRQDKDRVSDEDDAWNVENSGTYGWRNEYDNLPDNYFYSCNGLSGRFIFSPDMTECLEIPQSSTRIEKGGYGEPYFTITSDEGVRYNFEMSQVVWKNQYEVQSRIFNLESIYTLQCDTIDFTYYSAEYTKLLPKTVVEGITGVEFRTSESKEMPMNLVSKISLRGGESIEFILLGDREDCYSTTDTIPLYEGVKLVDRDGSTVRQFDLNYSYFESDQLLQYLPEGKYNVIPGDPRRILRGGYHIPFQDTSIYYDSIDYYEAVGDTGFQISYITDGEREYIENSTAFINGHYLFSWIDGELFALLNTDYLENHASYPEEEYIDFHCPPGLTPTQCDSINEADYDTHKAQWEREMDEYLNAATAVTQTYYPNFSDSATHYFKVDTAYYNDFIRTYIPKDSFCISCASLMRPFFQSHENEITKRLKLESIVELTGDLDTISPPITFEYDTTKLPHFYTNDLDHWGYSNYDGGAPNESPIPGGTSVYGYSYGQANESAMKARVLTKINYPYGGYVKYNFEANVARTNADGSTSEVVGGLRLNSVENGTGSGEKYYTNYEYKLFKDTIINGVYTLDTTGIPSGNLLSFQTQYQLPVGYEIISNSWDLVMTEVQESVLPLLKTKSGYVGYSEVAVSKSDDSGNTLGRTLYRFYPVDTLQYHGVSDYGSRPGASSVKFICPPTFSCLSGSLKEKIVADKWDQILTKSVQTYSESEPDFYPSEDSYYTHYIHSYTYLIEQSNFVAYLDPKTDYTNSNLYIFPKIPVLSSANSYSYYPDVGLTSADSVYYLYDTHNSQFNTSTYDYWGFVDAFDLSSGYSDALDAYLDFGTPGIEDYSIQCKNTHKPVFELRFKPNGDKIFKRYWYPPHLADSDTVYEKMVERNIISTPVKVETFLDTIRMEGQRTKFGVFSKSGSTNEDFLLPSVTEQYFVDQYEPVQEFISYSDHAAPLEVEKSNGNRSSSIWRDRGRTQIAVIENAEYDEFLFQDFEEDTIGYVDDWKIASSISTTQSYSDDAHTGKKSIRLVSVNSTSNSYVVAKKSISDLDANGRYTCSAWVKADTVATSGPDLVLYRTTSSGTTQVYRSLYDANKEGEWQLLQADIDLSDYTGVTEIEVRVRNIGSNSVACYCDDIRFYPSDAQMTTYTYDPLVGKTSEIGPSGLTAIYEYDDAGRLWRIKDNEGNILKQNTYHFAE